MLTTFLEIFSFLVAIALFIALSILTVVSTNYLFNASAWGATEYILATITGHNLLSLFKNFSKSKG